MWVVELRRVVALVCLVGAGCGDSSGTTGTAGTGGETGTGGSGTGGGAACPTDYAECDGNAATVCETSSTRTVSRDVSASSARIRASRAASTRVKARSPKPS